MAYFDVVQRYKDFDFFDEKKFEKACLDAWFDFYGSEKDGPYMLMDKLVDFSLKHGEFENVIVLPMSKLDKALAKIKENGNFEFDTSELNRTETWCVIEEWPKGVITVTSDEDAWGMLSDYDNIEYLENVIGLLASDSEFKDWTYNPADDLVDSEFEQRSRNWEAAREKQWKEELERQNAEYLSSVWPA